MTLTGINIRFLYLICGAKYGGFSSVQVYPKSYCIQQKTKRYSFHPYRLMFIFCQRRRHGCHMAFSLLESVHRIISPVQTIPTLQTYPESCYISRKTKAAEIPPIPLKVYSFQSRRHDIHTAFFLLESVHRIDSPVWIDSHLAIIQRKTKATGIHPNLCIESLRQRQAYSESCYIHENQSGTVFTHTA